MPLLRARPLGGLLCAALLACAAHQPARPPAPPPAPPAREVVDRHGHTLAHLPPRHEDQACAPDLFTYLRRLRVGTGRVPTRIDGGLQALAQAVLQQGLERITRTALPPTAGRPRPGETRVGTIAAIDVNELHLDLGGPVSGVLRLPPEPTCAGHGAPPRPAARFRPGERLLLTVRSIEAGGTMARLALPLQGALLALDPRSREVLALVGGYSQQPGDVDRVTEGARPVGALFQPIIYAAALATGRFSPRSLVEAGPFFPGAACGRVPLREALAQSSTAAAVRLLAAVGLEKVLDLASRLGMPRDRLPADLSLPLRARLTPWQVAGAYATLADTRAGRYAPPRLLEEPGEEELEGTPELPPAAAYQVSRMLHRVIETGTATQAQVLRAPDLAGKTGVGPGGRDAWFVGYHGDLLAVVWVGAEADAVPPLGAVEAALPIWMQFMHGAEALLPRAPAPLYRPEGVAEEAD